MQVFQQTINIIDKNFFQTKFATIGILNFEIICTQNRTELKVCIKLFCGRRAAYYLHQEI